MMMRVADYITDMLYQAGGKDVFLVTGGFIMHLTDALFQHGRQKYICCHHEQAVAMAAEAIGRLATDESAVGVFNLGSGESEPVRRIVEQIRDMIGPDLALGFGEIPFGSKQLMRLQADISHISAILGWKPTTTLSDGLKLCVDWHKALRQSAVETMKGRR